MADEFPDESASGDENAELKNLAFYPSSTGVFREFV